MHGRRGGPGELRRDEPAEEELDKEDAYAPEAEDDENLYRPESPGDSLAESEMYTMYSIEGSDEVTQYEDDHGRADSASRDAKGSL